MNTVKTLRLHEIHHDAICRIALITGFVSGLMGGITEAVKSIPTEPGWALINLISIPFLSAAAMWISARVTIAFANGVLRRKPDILTFSIDEAGDV